MDFITKLFKKEPIGCIAVIVSVITIFASWFISVNEINKTHENAIDLKRQEEERVVSFSASILLNEFERVYEKSQINIEMADFMLEQIEKEKYSFVTAKNLTGKYTILSEDQFIEYLSKVSTYLEPYEYSFISDYHRAFRILDSIDPRESYNGNINKESAELFKSWWVATKSLNDHYYMSSDYSILLEQIIEKLNRLKKMS